MSIDAIKAVVDLIEIGGVVSQEDIVKCLRSAIDQAERQEPVAYVSGYYAGHCVIEPLNRAMVMPDGMALYAAPPQRQPLTDEEIWWEYQALWPFHPQEEPRLAADMATFARAIERKHGIGGGE